MCIGCENNYRIRYQLRHSNQATVSHVHRQVGVLVHQSEHTILFTLPLEADNNCPSAEKDCKRGLPQNMIGLPKSTDSHVRQGGCDVA